MKLLLILCAGLAWAQTPAFDVVSLKLRKGEVNSSRDPNVRGRRVIGTAVTLNDLITYAFEVRYDQITGAPSWAGADRYDFEALSEGEGTLPTAESRRMMQSLLAERFHLRVHRETTEAPVYALVVGKGGPKFREADPEAKGSSFVSGSDKGLHLEAKKASMAQLVRQLSFTAGRPVVDQTGLAGIYAYTLDWFPANRLPPADLEAPSMFAAVQEQLGLRLESTKGPVERLVIDAAERPGEN